jgi:hypothetical protein
VNSSHLIIVITKKTKHNTMAKKEILAEALLDAKKIQDALNANTKEILRSVAREEIDGVVKESLEESGYEEEAVEDEPEESPAMGDQIPDDGTPSGGGDSDSNLVDPEASLGGTDTPEIPVPDEVGQDQALGMDADALGGDELDMTGASDDDVIAIYKKLSGEDEIEIVGDEIHLTISEPGEYIVKKGDLAPGAEGDEMAGMGDEEIGDDPTYEIDMDSDEAGAEPEVGGEEAPTEEPAAPAGDEAGSEEAPAEEPAEKDDKEDESLSEAKEEEDESIAEVKEEEDESVVKEAIPVGLAQAHRLPGKADIGQPRGAGAHTFPKESTSSTKPVVSEVEVKYKKLLTEATQLKNENEEFRQALKKFRSMLVETVVFNSNLSYVTKLFMEHSTTKDEKKKIIQRFDEEVNNLKESKRLYKTIVSELAVRKPINESVENKLIKDVTSSSSKQLNEATAYVDPSTQRIKDLINRVENKDKY